MTQMHVSALLVSFVKKQGRNELTSSEEYQYWVFERGYKAAIQDVTKVIQLIQSGRSIDLSAQLTANRAAYQ